MRETDCRGRRDPLTTDQRGVPFVRIYGAAVDVGAYEAQTLSLVVDTAEDESDGDFSAGDLSLREAIELTNANPGADTIVFAAGLAGSTITLTSGELPITDDLTITGLGADQLTISGNDASRIFRVDDADAAATITVEIRGLSLQDGHSDDGGAILNQEDLTVTDSTLVDNSADYGGGIANFGTLTVTHSTLANNSAGRFGGGVNNYGRLTITDSSVNGNTAPVGAEIYRSDRLAMPTATAGSTRPTSSKSSWPANTRTRSKTTRSGRKAIGTATGNSTVVTW